MDCTTFIAVWWVQRGGRLGEFPEGTYYLVKLHPLFRSNNNAGWRVLEGKAWWRQYVLWGMQRRDSWGPWSQKRLTLTAVGAGTSFWEMEGFKLKKKKRWKVGTPLCGFAGNSYATSLFILIMHIIGGPKTDIPGGKKDRGKNKEVESAMIWSFVWR